MCSVWWAGRGYLEEDGVVEPSSCMVSLNPKIIEALLAGLIGLECGSQMELLGGVL